MTMTKCKQCGKEVSTNAKTCPHCGEKYLGVPTKYYIAGFVFLTSIIWIISLLIDTDQGAPQKTLDKPQEIQLTIPNQINPDAAKLATQAWPYIKHICSGLDRYSASLKFDGVEENFSYAPDNAQRVTIKFLIPKNDKSIPSTYMVHGHRCFFEVSRYDGNLSIPKSGCKALCLDKEIAGTNLDKDDYFFPLGLDRSYLASPIAAKTELDAVEKYKYKAMRGDYQAQRNLAYIYSTSMKSEIENKILGCAWYKLILMSGSKKVDDGDIGNLQVYCGRISAEEQKAAESHANILHKKIYKK